MINPRILLQLPIFLLGSCAPLAPQTSIYVYNGSTRVPQITTSGSSQVATIPDTPINLNPTKSDCKRMELDELKAYQAPAFPGFNGIDGDDTEKIADVLINDNKHLRAEIKMLKEKYLCSLDKR